VIARYLISLAGLPKFAGQPLLASRRMAWGDCGCTGFNSICDLGIGLIRCSWAPDYNWEELAAAERKDCRKYKSFPTTVVSRYMDTYLWHMKQPRGALLPGIVCFVSRRDGEQLNLDRCLGWADVTW
jgi:hypothetical protein